MVRGYEWGREQVTVSGGVADLQPSAIQPHELVTRADKALYAAKRSGKDRIVGWTGYCEGGEIKKCAAKQKAHRWGAPLFGGGILFLGRRSVQG